MSLYQEIIFLKHFFKGLYCVENVKSYYTPLISPQASGRHYFWTNFKIPTLKGRISIHSISGNKGSIERSKHLSAIGIDLSKYKNINKEKALRDCVDPIIGQVILDTAIASIKSKKVE